MIRYYLKTQEQKFLDLYDDINDIKLARQEHILKVAREHGFVAAALSDFGEYVYFYMPAGDEAPLKGPAIEGFKAGHLTREDGKKFHVYELRANGRRATAIRKQIQNGLPSAPPETGDNWRNNNVSGVFAARLGLPDGVFAGGRLGSARVYKLMRTTIVCSLPCKEEGDDWDLAKPAVIPDGFTEITEREWHQLVVEHNNWVKQEGEA